MTAVWRPLFVGDDAARIRAIVEDIAVATADGPCALPGNVPAELGPVWQHGLDGLAGQSLLQAYLALHGDEARAETAIALLDRATDAAATLPLPPSLYFGFCGIHWVAAHLSGRLFEESQDNGREVDEALLAALDNPTWNTRYDLLEGIVGIGVYARERLPRRSAVRLIQAVVDRLAALAERSARGAAFRTPVDHLAPAYRASSPHGLYNLGIAHGVAGVISFLGFACRTGVEGAHALLADTITWLMAHERATEPRQHFANSHTPGDRGTASRLGWCHGDLAVATALLVAARGAQEPAWEQHARRLAISAAARDVEGAGVPDAGLCHGAAGVGHLFNRLHQQTGEAALGAAARRWLQHAVTMRRPGAGIAGYQMSQQGEHHDSPGFRVGASGVALALLASVSSVPPGWDRLLMAS